jgi:hypothetical protein
MAGAVVLFVALWGPAMLAQRRNFQEAAASEAGRGALATLVQLGIAPAMQLTYLKPRLPWLSALCAALFAWGAWRARKDHRLMLAALWLGCSLGVLAVLDWISSSALLDLPKYAFMGSPGLLFMLAAVYGNRRIAGHIAPALALGVCLFWLPVGWGSYGDWSRVDRLIREKAQPGEVMVVGITRQKAWWLGRSYLHLTQCASKPMMPMALLERPPEGKLLEELRKRETFWVMSDARASDRQATPAAIVPGTEALERWDIPGAGAFFHVRWAR